MESLLHWLRDSISGPSGTAYLEGYAVAVALVLAWFFPGIGDGWFRKVEDRFRGLAANPRRALWIAFAFPLVLRILQIPLYPPPQPGIHDEFSYLLIADTLLSGRLANPTHPMWQHLETIHVIFDPSYASKYPVGQGVALAIPQLVGLPAYVGLWLSCGAMTAAAFWMLRCWLNPVWALFGATVIFLRVSVLSSWMHTYWGGAVPAIGGALAIGALVRLLRKPVRKYALLLGAGLAILANSRPYEGFTLSAVLGGSLALWLVREKSVPWAVKMREVVIPLAVVSVAILGFLALHNYRVTGSVTKLPYQRNRELYGTPQTFYWQEPAPPPAEFRHREIYENYRWQLQMHEEGTTLRRWLEASWLKVREAWIFFLGPIWTLPLLFLPWALRGKTLVLPLTVVGLVFVAVGCYPFFFPHYLAPVTAVLLLMLLLCLQRLREFRLRGRACGLAFSRLLVTISLLSVIWQFGLDAYRKQDVRQHNTPRTQVMEALNKMGGSHVVFVRYAQYHEFHDEIVYNGADIDAGNVIWARDMGVQRNAELLTYYKGRRAWRFAPDISPPQLLPYEQVAAPVIPRIPGFPGFR